MITYLYGMPAYLILSTNWRLIDLHTAAYTMICPAKVRPIPQILIDNTHTRKTATSQDVKKTH